MELESQLDELESQKGHLEKSMSNTTTNKILIPTGVFVATFCILSFVVGFFYNFIGPTISETPGELAGLIVASVIIAIPIAMSVYNKRKQNDIDELEQTDNEIQELKNKLESMKK